MSGQRMTDERAAALQEILDNWKDNGPTLVWESFEFEDFNLMAGDIQMFLHERTRLRNDLETANQVVDAMRDQIGILTRERDEWESNAETAWEELAKAREVAREKLDDATYAVASAHHPFPSGCLCGYKSARKRDVTEHILDQFIAALGGGDDE